MTKTVHRLLMFALVAAITGCEEEQIRVQRVAKTPALAVRTLAVIIPREYATWFLKLSGPATAVAADEAGFRALVESVTFPAADKSLQWKTPEQWKDEGATPERLTGFRTPNGNLPTITELGPNAKDVLANVNRWRGQIGLLPVETDALGAMTKTMIIGDIKATWVDLINQGDAVFQLSRSVPVAKPSGDRPRLSYTTPPGWQTVPPSGMRAAAFRIGEKDDLVEVTIIPLDGIAGGLAANVNRWRGEVGLPELTEVQIKTDAKELTVDGRPATYVDLLGPDGAKRQRTLGVIALQDGMTWFLKMRGPADAVARQQAAFETFARSFQVVGRSS